jgi:hypothetical protein
MLVMEIFRFHFHFVFSLIITTAAVCFHFLHCLQIFMDKKETFDIAVIVKTKNIFQSKKHSVVL